MIGKDENRIDRVTGLNIFIQIFVDRNQKETNKIKRDQKQKETEFRDKEKQNHGKRYRDTDSESGIESKVTGGGVKKTWIFFFTFLWGRFYDTMDGTGRFEQKHN